MLLLRMADETVYVYCFCGKKSRSFLWRELPRDAQQNTAKAELQEPTRARKRIVVSTNNWICNTSRLGSPQFIRCAKKEPRIAGGISCRSHSCRARNKQHPCPLISNCVESTGKTSRKTGKTYFKKNRFTKCRRQNSQQWCTHPLNNHVLILSHDTGSISKLPETTASPDKRTLLSRSLV